MIEIHLVEFDTEHDFDNFKQDEERRKFLHLKDESVKTLLLIKGGKLKNESIFLPRVYRIIPHSNLFIIY